MIKSILHTRLRRNALALLGGALLCAICGQGGASWPLAFVFMLPWLLGLHGQRGFWPLLAWAWAISCAFSLAGFAWFGAAIGAYTGIGAGAGIALLVLLAPLFQPQILAFVLLRGWAMPRYGHAGAALIGASAWLACEWLYPKLLGDTLGHILYPARLLRQGAELGGAASLTLLILLVNEALCGACLQRRQGWRAWSAQLGLAALPLALLTGFGLYALQRAPAPVEGAPLRIALVQSNLTDYEAQRKAIGAQALTSKILDTHFAMSYDALVRQGAHAVMWSETAYPTTFGQPKSAAGAHFDKMIQSIVREANAPFVFGSYERDKRGEYNAAIFLGPDGGKTGSYRKTRLFPFTEYVPAWLDSPWLRRALPWSGAWQSGDGARVLPLRLRDGREIPVLPLICRDDMDVQLGLAGVRLGAQAILTMSNDSWFSAWPQGAQWHQAAAAFRSVETRLPQFRVTTNGYSALIDPYGDVLAASRMGEAGLVVGEISLRTPPPTLLAQWGDWIGPAAATVLLLYALHAISVRLGWHAPQMRRPDLRQPIAVSLLPPGVRAGAALLRVGARLGLLWLAWQLWRDEALRLNTLAQMRSFAAFCILPEALAWALLQLFRTRLTWDAERLQFQRGSRCLSLPLAQIQRWQNWRLAWPGPGLTLHMADGARYTLYSRQIAVLHALLPPAGAPASRLARFQHLKQSLSPGLWDAPLMKYALLPLLLALPAYYLHQNITFGSGFGEWQYLGAQAWLRGMTLWWAAWVIGITLCGALLRLAIEVCAMLAMLLRPAQALAQRQYFEWLGKLALFAGAPGWLLLRVFGA
ncbi:apolipoprotein N-acyltransferase [Massilia sp. W12]|uniref:apolipoprotein N-acyltransferase n=1 Tax=Massilia sp. W12 TaxID=3126507 RepID=UPI0030CA91F5